MMNIFNRVLGVNRLAQYAIENAIKLAKITSMLAKKGIILKVD